MGWGPVKMARHLCCNSGLEDVMIILGKFRKPGQEKKTKPNPPPPKHKQTTTTTPQKTKKHSNRKTYYGIICLKELYTAKTSRDTVNIYHFAFKDLSQCYCGELSFILSTHPILYSDLVVYKQLWSGRDFIHAKFVQYYCARFTDEVEEAHTGSAPKTIPTEINGKIHIQVRNSNIKAHHTKH